MSVYKQMKYYFCDSDTALDTGDRFHAVMAEADSVLLLSHLVSLAFSLPSKRQKSYRSPRLLCSSVLACWNILIGIYQYSRFLLVSFNLIKTHFFA